MPRTTPHRSVRTSDSNSIMEQLELNMSDLENAKNSRSLANFHIDSKTRITAYDKKSAKILGIEDGSSPTVENLTTLPLKQRRRLVRTVKFLLASENEEEEQYLRLELGKVLNSQAYCLTLATTPKLGISDSRICCTIEPIGASKESEEPMSSFDISPNNGLELWSMKTSDRLFNWVQHTSENNGKELKPPSVHLDNWIQHIVEDDKALFKNGFTQLLSGEQDNFHLRYQFKTLEGGTKWVSTIARRKKPDVDDEEVNIIGLHREEKEIPNVVDDLRLFSYLAKKVQLAILVTDPAGKTTWCNNAFTEISGYSIDEIVTKTPGTILQGPLSDKDAIQHMEERTKKGKAFHAELVNYKKNGVPFWTRIDANPLVDENGKLIRYIAFLTDITESKKTQSAILRNEIKFRSLFDNSIDALLLVSPKDGVIIESNKAAIDFFDTDRLVGQKLNDLFPESEVLRVELLNEMVSDGEGTRRETGEFVRANGDRQPVEMTINRTPIGEAIALFVTLRDISEKRLLEEQLRHAQRMEAVGRLAGGIAHDFNNLLAGLRGFSELLCNSRDLTKRDHVYSNEVLKITDRASKLTNRLLSFSRGKSEKPIVTNLNEIVGNITPMLSRILKKDIEFTSKLDPTLGNVKVDPNQIEQVVMNLVVNGQEAISSANGKVLLSTGTTLVDGTEIYVTGKPKAGYYATVTVRDNGQGIQAELMEKIFEPFFTTKKGAGTGLGLSIVYGIIQNNGGHLHACSEIGQGTTFTFLFPIVAEPIAVLEGPETSFTMPTEPKSHSDRKTILVAEDQDQVREILELGLGQCGYELLVADNGMEAIELAQNRDGKIDMLITDSIMPRASGYQVIKSVRECYPDIKVIMISGLPQNESEDAEAVKVDAYVDKPFSIKNLIQLIESSFALK